MNKALFLDRDGVINIDKQYVHKKEDFEFIDGVFETCRAFMKQGYLLIIVTNQSGIARGYYSEKDFSQLTDWMKVEFSKEGVVINKVYFCPHHVGFTHECDCRKPEPGMILKAQKDFNVDLSQSILVGDKMSDIEAGLAAGVGENYFVTEDPSYPVDIPCKKVNKLSDLLSLVDL